MLAFEAMKGVSKSDLELVSGMGVGAVLKSKHVLDFSTPVVYYSKKKFEKSQN